MRASQSSLRDPDGDPLFNLKPYSKWKSQVHAMYAMPEGLNRISVPLDVHAALSGRRRHCDCDCDCDCACDCACACACDANAGEPHYGITIVTESVWHCYRVSGADLRVGEAGDGWSGLARTLLALTSEAPNHEGQFFVASIERLLGSTACGQSGVSCCIGKLTHVFHTDFHTIEIGGESLHVPCPLTTAHCPPWGPPPRTEEEEEEEDCNVDRSMGRFLQAASEAGVKRCLVTQLTARDSEYASGRAQLFVTVAVPHCAAVYAVQMESAGAMQWL